MEETTQGDWKRNKWLLIVAILGGICFLLIVFSLLGSQIALDPRGTHLDEKLPIPNDATFMFIQVDSTGIPHLVYYVPIEPGLYKELWYGTRNNSEWSFTQIAQLSKDSLEGFSHEITFDVGPDSTVHFLYSIVDFSGSGIESLCYATFANGSIHNIELIPPTDEFMARGFNLKVSADGKIHFLFDKVLRTNFGRNHIPLYARLASPMGNIVEIPFGLTNFTPLMPEDAENLGFSINSNGLLSVLLYNGTHSYSPNLILIDWEPVHNETARITELSNRSYSYLLGQAFYDENDNLHVAWGWDRSYYYELRLANETTFRSQAKLESHSYGLPIFLTDGSNAWYEDRFSSITLHHRRFMESDYKETELVSSNWPLHKIEFDSVLLGLRSKSTGIHVVYHGRSTGFMQPYETAWFYIAFEIH